MKFSNKDALVSEIEKTHKTRAESEFLLKQTTAKCFHRLAKDGRPEYMNFLYSKASPTDQTAIRVFFCNRIIDLFGIGGVRDPEDQAKWLVRPQPFFFAAARPDSKLIDANGNPKHFGLVNTVDKDENGTDPTKNRPAWLKKLADADPKQAEIAIANLKAFRKAVTDAGPEKLVFDWITRDQASRIEGPADVEKAGTQFVGSIKRLAKALAAAGMSRSIVDDVMDVLPADWIDKKDRKEIRELFKANQPVAVPVTAKPSETPKDETPSVDPATIAAGMEQMGQGQEPAH